MSNRLVFYHRLIKTAGGLSEHQEGIAIEFEPEAINQLRKSYAYAPANRPVSLSTAHSQLKGNMRYESASSE